MSNYKRKANYQASRSCGLCKPHKRVGNKKERVKPKYRLHKQDLQKSLTLAQA